MVLRYVVNGVWGIFDDFFRIFHILVTHPVPILSALFVIWLVYRIFRYMGFGQRRSILLSAPYQNGEHYASNLRANISDPHQFYLQEAGVLMRPTYCNVCSQRMLGASDIALSCDICGFAAHDHCVPRITQGCKSVSLLPTPALAFSFDCAFRTLTSGALLPPLPPRARACRGGASGLCGSSSTMTNVSLFSASSASAAGTPNGNDHECDEEDDDGEEEEEENEADVLALATPVEHAAAFSSALAAAAASSAAAAAAVAAAGVGVGVGKAGRGVLVRRYRALIEERKHEEWCASALAITAAAAAARIAADAEAAAAVAAAAEGGDACPETAVMVQPKRTATRASASTSGGGSKSDGVVTLRRSARVRSRSRPAHARALVSDASAAANGDDSGDGNDDVKDGMSSSQVVSRSSTSAVAAAATAATAAAAAAAAAAASAASGAHVGGLTSPAQPHHWTRGNHSTLSDVCIACGEVTGSLFSLSGLHCLWCRANVHEGCVVDVGRTHAHCSRGAIAKLIVPPTSVFPAPGFTAASARLAISSLRRGAPAPPAAPASPSDADAAAPAAAAVGGSSGRVLTLGGLVSDIVKGTAPAAEGISQWDPLLHAAAPVAAAVAAAAGASDFAALSAESSSSPSSAAAAAAAAAAAGSVSDSATAASCGHVLPPLSSLLALPPSDPLLTTPLVYRVLPPPDVTPLLVFVNRKSGGNTGIQLMHEFAELLSPIQVWDLSEHPPEVALSLFATVPRLQAVVCGGDGTVSWVLSAIDKLGRPIPLAVVPLGTGNDLSQVLGWGKTSPGMDGSGLLPTLQRVARAGICVLDRWNAEVKPLPMLEGADEHGAATMTAATESAGASESKELSAQRSKPSSQSRVLRTPGPTRRRLPATARPAATAAVVVVEGPVSESGVEHKESSGKAARSNDDDDDDDDDAVLHSGHSCWQRLKASPLVQRISAVFPVVTPSPRGRGSSSAVVCNYMGIGLDAVIAHKFHRLRANYPHLFSSQLLNKMWYARLGSDAYFFPHAPTVLQDSKVQVFVDGTELDLTNMQGVCLLNIKSFGGGINFWGIAPTEARFQEPSMDDSMLEVIGFESSLHIGTIQMGMGTPHRLAQGRNIVIRTRGPLPFQVDGEPWGVKTHCEVHVTLRGQSLMMTPDDGSAAVGGGPLAGAGDVLGARAAAAGATAAGLGATAMLNDTLHWAQARGVISEAQAQVILTEFSKKHRKMLPSNTRFYEARTHTGD